MPENNKSHFSQMFTDLYELKNFNGPFLSLKTGHQEEKTQDTQMVKEKISQAVENVKQQTHEQSKVGTISWKDILFYLNTMGTWLLPLICVAWKMGVHSLNVFYEVRLSIFASTCTEQTNSIFLVLNCF